MYKIKYMFLPARRSRGAAVCAALLCALALLAGCGVSSAGTQSAEPTVTDVPTAAPTATPAPTPTPAPEWTAPPTAEPTSAVVNMLACGDIVPHYELLVDAKTDDGYDFKPQFGDLAGQIAAADYAFCTVEAAFIGEPYASFPRFLTTEDLAVSLRDLGYDMIACASNHAVDGGYKGIVATIDLYESLGLDHIGTFRTQAEREDNRGILVRDINGIRFAFLDYTACTNGIWLREGDFAFDWAVSNLFEGYYEISPFNLQYDEIALDIQAARDSGADVIIAVCHWGAEYAFNPAEYQYELADFFIERGVDVIIGSHPHVLQPMETRTVEREDGSTRTAYICYSLGNLLTGMFNYGGDVTPFVNMRFEKDPLTGRTEITDFTYTPAYRASMPQYHTGDERDWRLMDIDADLAAYEAGTAPYYVTEQLYRDLVKARTLCLDVCGTELYAGAADEK